MDTPGKKWVIGDTFLRRYYSIYDDDRGLVGFVRSLHPDEPATGPKHESVVGKSSETVAQASMAAPLSFVAGVVASQRNARGRRTAPLSERLGPSHCRRS